MFSILRNCQTTFQSGCSILTFLLGGVWEIRVFHVVHIITSSWSKAIVLVVLIVGDDISLWFSLHFHNDCWCCTPFHMHIHHSSYFFVIEVSMLHTNGQIFQHNLLRLSFPTELPLHFCQKSIDHIYGDLFLDSLFHSPICLNGQYYTVLINVAL